MCVCVFSLFVPELRVDAVVSLPSHEQEQQNNSAQHSHFLNSQAPQTRLHRLTMYGRRY